MKRPALVVVAGTVLIAASGGGAIRAAGPSPDDSVTAPVRFDDGDRSRTELREPEDDVVDPYPRIFDRHKANGRKVTLFYYSGVDECYGLHHIKIRERARKVILTVFEGRDPEAEACPEIAVAVRSVATLRRPLGDRPVVDGAG